MRVNWLFLANAFNRVLTVATQLAVGFLLVPEQVGIFAVAAGLVGMVSPFQSGDHARLALQDPDDSRAAAAVLRNWLLMGSLLSCLVVVIALPLAGVSASLGLMTCLVVLSMMRVMSNVRIALLSQAGRGGAIAALNTAEGCARSLVLVGSALLGAGVWSLVFGEVAAVLSTAMCSNRLEQGPASGGFRLPRPLVRKLMVTVAVCLLVGVELNCTAVAIGHLCSAASAGSFAFANRIAGQITMLVLPLIAVEMIPRLLAVRGDGGRFQAVSRIELRRLVPLILALVAMLVIAGPMGLIMVWGERWREAAGMIPWLGVSLGLRLGYVMAKAHLEALGSFAWILKLSVLDTACIVAAAVAGGVFGGPDEIVWLLTCESAFVLAVSICVVRQQTRRIGSDAQQALE